MRFLLLLSLLFSFSANIYSKVIVENGNFNLDFFDVKEDSGFELYRAYNSASFVSGMFGYGWGTPYEAMISNMGGLVVVEEVPGGGKSFYLPKEKADLSKVVNIIIDSVTKDGQKYDKGFIAKLKASLSEDEALIVEFAKKYKIKSTAAVGTVFISRERPMEYVKKTPTGYFRLKNSGEKDEYNKDGQLARLLYPNGDNLRFSYGLNGRLSQVQDSKGRSMKFSFNESGLVTKILLHNGLSCEYKYNASGDLTESTDAGGHVYSYNYDAYHNLTELTFPPSSPGGSRSKTLVKYDIAKDKAVYQKTPDGQEIYYEYLKNDEKDDYYSGTKVMKKFNNAVDVEKYELWRRPRPDGSLYTYKMRETRNKDVKTAVYTQCCGTPLMIDVNGKVTRFEYDGKGMLKKKIFPDNRVLDVKYNSKGLIEKILNNGDPYLFKYDEYNRIAFAGMRKVKFKISYDKKGRLLSMKDNLARAFGFDYDSEGRVKRLTSKSGDISIKYDSQGNMDYVSMDETDDKMWEIRKAYQQYLEVMSVLALLDERY